MTEKTTLHNLYRIQAIAARLSDSARVASGSAQCAAQHFAGRTAGEENAEMIAREIANAKLFRAALGDMIRLIDFANADVQALGFGPIKANRDLTHPDDIEDEEEG